MKQITFLILAACFFSCQKSEDAPPVVDDPKDSVIVGHSYPMTVVYKGTLKVSEMQAAHNPAEDYYFDTVYAESLNVQYPDSTSVTFHLNYWCITSLGQRFYNSYSHHFEINTSGVYLPKLYDFFSYGLKGDSLNIRIRHSGGPSHQLDVNFAGSKVR